MHLDHTHLGTFKFLLILQVQVSMKNPKGFCFSSRFSKFCLIVSNRMPSLIQIMMVTDTIQALLWIWTVPGKLTCIASSLALLLRVGSSQRGATERLCRAREGLHRTASILLPL